MFMRKIELRYSRVRVAESPVDYERSLTCSADVAAVARALFGSEVTEVISVFMLSVKNKIIGYQEVARGGVSSCSAKPADVFRGAIVSGAVSIILAHNHPSGDSVPSRADIEWTNKMRTAGEALGVRVLDHVVVTDETFFSFVDTGI